KLANNGIYQLRKGESIQDALDAIDNGTTRKGYEFKHRDGSQMSQNAIIAESNKEALSKTVRTPVQVPHDDCINVEDITGEDDFRNDLTKVGEIQECQYCNKPLRVDEGATFDIINCESCMDYAILQNCM